MPKAIVADTSCLILFYKIGELKLLKKVFGRIFITETVLKEFNKEIPEIEVPALIIIGELDHPDMHQIANLLEMRIEKGQKILISQTGHMVSMERPQEFERIIINFLGKR